MQQSTHAIRILKSLPLVKSWEARMSMLNPIGMFYKRCFDIVFSLVACVAIALFIPIIALIIKLQSRGPIFFVQDRTGKYGRTFRCLKFRTMRTNGECNIRQCTKHDPRVFPFGRFLRRTNLDELPQFFNVLMGDMSIVGPRPHMLYHTHYYSKRIPQYMSRHLVRPGITGWAQVTGFRGETSELWQMEERVRRDMWYIDHWSLRLDLRIVFMTVKTIFVHDEMAY
ncbi:MAG: exopolysaccharide biosynthesis polyprenyl glycosylphosphotransferase [Prevotella sp.]|nr:exopolysaccharide biosynthesis polyprenyl glycosylphosphotransferase [Prevotella sp.]